MDSCGTGFYASGTGTTGRQCVSCSNHCSSCFDASTCEECSDGYYLHEGECKSRCPSGTYADGEDSSTGRECVDCSQNCLGCTNATTCLFCGNSKHLYSDTCVDRCPAGYFASWRGSGIVGRMCIPCRRMRYMQQLKHLHQMWFRAVSAERRLCCCLSCWSGITRIWCRWSKV